jgi:predicted DNA-binding WGR domain protein
MPRYELSDGSSNKFWDIQLSGKAFTVTFGKIGANGQTQRKTFKTDAEARTAHDKLVAEKTKKGYVLVGGAASNGGGKLDARNPDLEKAIAANPTDLSLGTMTDEGARALAAAKASLQHLEVLDLHHNYLTKDGIKLVKGLARKVITDDQQTPSDWSGELHYYTAIAE